jgi:CheY-like chemotaxis protein
MAKKRIILIAEDEMAMMDALQRKFKKEGIEVLAVSDGEQALETALKQKPDLCLLDIVMPKMDGLRVAEKIREDKKWGQDVPIVILTNLSDPSDVSRAASFGVYDFLVKTDWRLDDVVEFIKGKLNI